MSRSPAIAAVAIAIIANKPPDKCLTMITSDAPRDVSPILWSRVKIVYDEIMRNGR